MRVHASAVQPGARKEGPKQARAYSLENLALTFQGSGEQTCSELEVKSCSAPSALSSFTNHEATCQRNQDSSTRGPGAAFHSGLECFHSQDVKQSEAAAGSGALLRPSDGLQSRTMHHNDSTTFHCP